MDKLIKTDHAGYSKNPETGMIINTDMSKLAAIKEQRQFRKDMYRMNDEIKQLQKDIKELKEKIENGIYNKSS